MADSSSAPIGTFVVFSVASTFYALRSECVSYMEMVEQVTRVPNAAPFVDGVVFSRGQVVPAVNLRARFGFDRLPYEPRTRLLVVHAAGRTLGLIVDTAREFVRFPVDAIQPPQEGLTGTSGRYVDGIVSLNDRLILVLDLEQLMSVSEPLVAA